jgi:hypothetical protein
MYLIKIEVEICMGMFGQWNSQTNIKSGLDKSKFFHEGGMEEK